MKNRITLFILVVACSLFMFGGTTVKRGPGGGGSGVSTGEVADLPVAGPVGELWQITDGADDADCTVGGAAVDVLCMWDGAAWVPTGDSGVGTGDAINVGVDAVDTTATLTDGDIDWTIVDGGAGGPDGVTATVECAGCVSENDIAASLVFDDGDVLSLGSVLISGVAEGLILPLDNADNCAASTGEGQVCWDDGLNHLWIGNGIAAERQTWVIGTDVQAWDAQLDDLADGTLTGDFVNTANPWADNEVVDALTVDDAGIAATITRDLEWDTLAEINAASTDTDAVLDTDIGVTVPDFVANTYSGTQDGTSWSITDAGVARFESVADDDGPGTNWEIDAAGAASFSGLTIDPSATPQILFTDSDNSGEAKILVGDAAGPETTMTLSVDTGAGVDTPYIQLDGVNNDIELGDPGTNYVDITTGGVLTFVGTGDIVLPALSVDAGTYAADSIDHDDLNDTITFEDGSLLDFGTLVTGNAENNCATDN